MTGAVGINMKLLESFKKNSSIDIHSKVWWVSVVSILLVLIQQLLGLFGVQLPDGLSSRVMDIVNSILLLGGLTGVIYDTSNKQGVDK